MLLEIEEFHGEFKAYWISGKLKNWQESDVLRKGKKEAEKEKLKFNMRR